MTDFAIPGVRHYLYHPPYAPSKGVLFIRSTLPRAEPARKNALIGQFNLVNDKGEVVMYNLFFSATGVEEETAIEYRFSWILRPFKENENPRLGPITCNIEAILETQNTDRRPDVNRRGSVVRVMKLLLTK